MLELRDVDTSYGAVPMLRGVAMSVRPGELVCLLGPNGAGKTTTFMTVCGVVRAQRGKVEVMGRDMATLGTENLASLGVGLVPEGRRLFPGLTVMENLRLGYDAVSGSPISGCNWTRCASCFRASMSVCAKSPARCPAANRRWWRWRAR